MEKLLKKLRKILAKLGKSDDEIESIVGELEKEDVADDEKDTIPAEAQDKEKPVDSDELEESEEEKEKVVVDPTEKVEEKDTEKVEELEPTVSPVELPEEKVDAPIPAVEPSGVGLDEIKQQLEEKDATIQALSAKVDSLLDSLKKAGILSEESVSTVEVAPAAPGNDIPPVGGLDDFLKDVNGGSVR